MKIAALLAVLLISLTVACNDDDGSPKSERPQIPTPIAQFVRQDCDSVASADYFLSDEERTWFKTNCNRQDCLAIQGTEYLSSVERTWYLDNCVAD